jgi:hypothetical protein
MRFYFSLADHRPLRIGSLLVTLLAGVNLSCTSKAQLEADRKQFPSISANRPLGSPCAEKDAASVRRRPYHPLVPTGGWNPSVEINPARQPSRPSQGLALFHSLLAGYLRFPSSGQLRLRSYDDVYGDVYCHWSPAKADLPAAAQSAFVAFGTCGVGDGGLAQVYEACWFPAGASQGTIIYSSAHPNPQATANAADLYRPQDLGTDTYFNDRLAFEALSAALLTRQLPLVRSILADSLAAFARLRPLVDGSTGKPLAPTLAYRDTYARLLSLQMVSSLGQPNFNQLADTLQPLLTEATKFSCSHCPALAEALPRYRRLHQQILTSAPPTETLGISECDQLAALVLSHTKPKKQPL